MNIPIDRRETQKIFLPPGNDDKEKTGNMREQKIHPAATVHPDAKIGDNVTIGANAVIHRGVTLGHGAVVGECAVVGKSPQLGAASTAKKDGAPAELAIEDGVKIGAHATVCLGSRLAEGVLVADYAMVRERVSLGRDTVIGAKVTVENDVRIGERCKIQTGAYITALTEIEDGVFVAPCVITTNDNFMGRTEERFKYKGGPKIRKGARIGAGALILPNIVIGKEAFVAAGSVVTHDVEEYTLVMGVPARPVSRVNEKEVLY